MSERPRFHLAVAVDDLSAAEAFYAGVLQCRIGRAAKDWIDFDLWGHQLTVHRCAVERTEGHNSVEGADIVIPHFGVILSASQWQTLVARLQAYQVSFELDPGVRFAGKSGEQSTLFLRDPAGNMLEFKSFQDDTQVFARTSSNSATP